MGWVWVWVWVWMQMWGDRVEAGMEVVVMVCGFGSQAEPLDLSLTLKIVKCVNDIMRPKAVPPMQHHVIHT